MLLAEFQELELGQEGVDFDLVYGGGDPCDGEELLEVRDCEVGDTDGAGEAAVLEGFKRPPGGGWVEGEFFFDNVLRGG